VPYFPNFKDRKEQYRIENPFFNEQLNFIDSIFQQRTQRDIDKDQEIFDAL
jgi:hypothetical protein